MKIKNTLQILAQYYGTTRQVGHTTELLRDVDNAIVLCWSHSHCEDLKKHYGTENTKYLTLGSITQSIRGFRKPLLVDNAVMYVICKDAYDLIEELEKENNRLQQKLDTIQAILKQ